jgi:hypothetical protein
LLIVYLQDIIEDSYALPTEYQRWEQIQELHFLDSLNLKKGEEWKKSDCVSILIIDNLFYILKTVKYFELTNGGHAEYMNTQLYKLFDTLKNIIDPSDALHRR